MTHTPYLTLLREAQEWENHELAITFVEKTHIGIDYQGNLVVAIYLHGHDQALEITNRQAKLSPEDFIKKIITLLQKRFWESLATTQLKVFTNAKGEPLVLANLEEDDMVQLFPGIV